MKDVAVTIYRRSEDLPAIEYKSFFHGKSLFALYEQTPRHVPYMAVATDADGKVLCNMLAVVRHRFSVFPPYTATAAYTERATTTIMTSAPKRPAIRKVNCSAWC